MPASTAPHAPPSSPTGAARCPLCGGDNACGQAGAFRATCADNLDCWCKASVMAPAALSRIPADRRGIACICRRCAATG